MVSVCFYFQVHQPFRIKKYSIFDIGRSAQYFEEGTDSRIDNKKIMRKVAEKCYLPTNAVLLESIKKYPQFKVSFSISGIALEQFQRYAPDVLKSFQELVKTGNVEMLEETYYHSLAFLYSKKEFREQIQLHNKKIFELFGVRPRVFRNTELIYQDTLAEELENLGYKGIIAEGADHILGWRSPNFVYTPPKSNSIRLLLKNYRLSDDIAFRFSNHGWEEWPLTAPKFTQWINAINGGGQVVNLFMDYETFGEHQWADTGIFEFMSHLPKEILKHPDNNFKTPSEVIDSYSPIAKLSVPDFVSWADIERDLTAWMGNDMQRSALHEVFALEQELTKSKDPDALHVWRKLQTSDHFYYMCTKWFADGDVHKYFNPYESPYDAFIAYMNVLQDLKIRLKDKKTNIYKQLNISTDEQQKNQGYDMTKELPQEQYFWLQSGEPIKSLSELAHHLDEISPSIFDFHVNSSKNDFANWIRHVFKEETLANKIQSMQGPQAMAQEIRLILEKETKKITKKIKTPPVQPIQVPKLKQEKQALISQLKSEFKNG